MAVCLFLITASGHTKLITLQIGSLRIAKLNMTLMFIRHVSAEVYMILYVTCLSGNIQR